MAKVDKYGNRVDTQDSMMSKFYDLENSKSKTHMQEKVVKGLSERDQEVENSNEGSGEKFYDEEGKFKWDAKSSSEGEDENSDEE